jgi:signal transduction histidine kinase
MTLQARLTLSSVLVTTVIVAVVSAVDLGNDMERQFEDTLRRAELIRTNVSNAVRQAVERAQQDLSLREALRQPELTAQLQEILADSPSLVEIAVCDRKNEILLDSDPKRLGETFSPNPDFGPLVKSTGWLGKLRILSNDSKFYQLEQPLGPPGGEALLHVRVVVAPALIRHDISPTLRKNATVAVLSVLGAVIITLVFSTLAFRSMGRLGKMVDLLSSGQYDFPEALALPPPAKTDEFGVMASKVSLLGEQLRGARYDYSDLRGNFERLLDDLEDAVLIFGRDRRLVIASGAVERFLGRMRSDLLHQPMTDIFPPNTPVGLLIAQAAQTGRPIHNRRVPLTTGGGSSGPPMIAVVLLSVDMMESLTATNNPGRVPAVAVRLRDPEATRQIGRQLQTADRLSAISRITGGVAHEVKNPLNAILMHVEVARMKLAKGETDLEPQMEIISREILRLDRVVKTFLDFTRPVELNLTEVPLDEFMNEIVDLARPQAAFSGIEVAVDGHTAGVMIRVDRDLLKQAVLNVAMNAIEAMPGGGRLRFESEIEHDEAEIRIADTGTGIPPELRDKIFRLYFTTKKEGSGIGLAMTFRIVQLHDGTIDFTSEPGKGTTFSVRLPVV